MKSILTTLLLLLVCLNLSAQSAEWTKADRNVLFDEYNSFLVQYKNLSQEQRESLSLCCLDETTKGYTKAQYNAKIDVELKRIKEATIIQCAKNMGVELNKSVPESEKPEVKVESTSWTKEDKSKLAKIASEYLNDYEHISIADKDKITLCFIEEITTNKTKEEYDLLIDLELRQLKSTTITKCAKKLSISMEAPQKKEVVVEKSVREQLIGTWNTDQFFIIQFKDDGTFIKTFTSNFATKVKQTDHRSFITNRTTNGNWFIDNSGVITLNETVKLEYYIEFRRYTETRYENYSLQSTWFTEELNDKSFKIKYKSGVTCCPYDIGQYSGSEIVYPSQILGNKQ